MSVNRDYLEQKKKKNELTKDEIITSIDLASGKKAENTADFVSMTQEEEDLSDLFDDADEAVCVGESGGNDSTSSKEQTAIGISSQQTTQKASFSFEVTTCDVLSSTVGRESVFSLVHTAKNGIRAAISRKRVLDEIGATEKVQVAYSTEMNAIILGTNLGGTSYVLKSSHGKGIIYNKELVLCLEKAFNLDFSNQTTHSFYDVEVIEHVTCGKIAVVKKGV